MAQLHVIVVTPERKLLDEPARFVALPLYDGEKGVLPLHAPMMGRLGAGELRIEGPSGTKRFYVEEGFVDVFQNTVSVLTPRAIPAEQLDEAVVSEQLDRIRREPARRPEQADARRQAAARLRTQLRIIRRTRQ